MNLFYPDLPPPPTPTRNPIYVREYKPLKLVCHVVQKRLGKEDKTHWDKTEKEHFLCLPCPGKVFAVQQGISVPRDCPGV